MVSDRPAGGLEPQRTETWHTGPKLHRGVLSYLFAFIIPAAAGLAVLPLLAGLLGVERLGTLALAWAVMGHSAALSLGFPPAVIQLAAGRPDEEVARIVWTALSCTAIAGLAGAVLIALGASAFVPLLNLAAPQAQEAERLLWVLAAATPLLSTTSVLTAVLELRGRFLAVNTINVASLLINYVGTLAILYVHDDLVLVGFVIVGARLFAWLGCLTMGLRVVPLLRARPSVSRTIARSLFGYGRWVLVSIFVGLFMVFSDRFLIGGLLGVAAVAYYAPPKEIVTRLGPVSGAVVAVLLPALATARLHDHSRRLIHRAQDATAGLLLPPIVALAALAPELLAAWMGDQFAAEGAAALRWLVFGLMVSGLAKIPAVTLAAHGRPDMTAKLHILEVLPFVAIALILIPWLGVVGAAIAWTARAIVDAIAIHCLANQVTGGWSRDLRPLTAAALAAALIALGSFDTPLHWRLAIAALAAFAGAVYLFGAVRDPPEPASS
jgi:O-antigen/teichoic acid export membrane protein